MESSFLEMERASQMVDGIIDPITKTLVSHAVMRLAKTIAAGKTPRAPLDMPYLVDLLKDIMEQHRTLRLALDGVNLDW